MSTTATQPGAASALANPMLIQTFKISRVRLDTYDSFTLDLVPTETGAQFSFQPGQFNMMYVFGTGEVPISISGDPTKPGQLIHTTRAVGTVTKAMKKLGII